MNFNKIIIALYFLVVFGFAGIGDCALPFGVFPLLTSGWYYKPSPVEAVFLGLIVVKVLALRLASITGLLPIPYHLNDLFVRSLGKRSTVGNSRKLGHLTMPLESHQSFRQSRSWNRMQKATQRNSAELAAMYRVLLGLRRIDVNDCFLKMLCVTSRRLKTRRGSTEDRQIIETLQYLISSRKYTLNSKNNEEGRAIDAYHNALSVGMGGGNDTNRVCDSAYMMCSLTEKAMKFDAALSDLLFTAPGRH